MEDLIKGEPDWHNKVNENFHEVDSQMADIAINIKSFGAKGDGTTDDTAAIQYAIDTHAHKIVIPNTGNPFMISKMLTLHSYQELHFQEGATIKLLSQSNCLMLSNDANAVHISITGRGIIDGNRSNQTRQDTPIGGYIGGGGTIGVPNGTWFGMVVCMYHVTHLKWDGVSIKNPTTWGLTFADAHYFTVTDVFLDYGNPAPINTDGVHLCGYCDHFKISNITGSTGDDMVPLNANDKNIYAFCDGPITDGSIEHVIADGSYRGVKLLSDTALIKNISIKDVSGDIQNAHIQFLNLNPDTGKGNIDDITIEDIKGTTTLGVEGIIEIDANVNSITISKVKRTQSQFDTSTNYQATINVKSGYVIDKLILSKLQNTDNTTSGITIVNNAGTVKSLIVDNVQGGNSTQLGNFLKSTGLIEDLLVSNIYVGKIENLFYADAGGTIKYLKVVNLIADAAVAFNINTNSAIEYIHGYCLEFINYASIILKNSTLPLRVNSPDILCNVATLTPLLGDIVARSHTAGAKVLYNGTNWLDIITGNIVTDS